MPRFLLVLLYHALDDYLNHPFGNVKLHQFAPCFLYLFLRHGGHLGEMAEFAVLGLMRL